MGTSQHRRVFVGNIPYDATEEQLVQICEEVGPVVSFRLVLDRETGKPKGYGFCEYKDEETALSARRNLMGYEINGRQLRVDFAENDKGADRNREQGRGGPGLVTNADTKKQSRGHGDSSLQPIGVPVAVAAASVMEGTLGGAQAGAVSAQIRLSNQSGLDSDPLTLHLAKMSRNQLSEIMSALKGMATQNKELARRLLLSNPQLLKALFQTEIMLQMVSPQALQMPNACHASSTLSQSLIQEVPQLDQTLSRLPSTSQKSLQAGLMPKVQAGQMPVVSQNSLLPSQFPALPQTPSQLQQLGNNNQLLQPASLPVHSINSKTLGHLPVRAQSQMVISSSLQPKMQLPLVQQVTTRAGGTDAGYNNQMLTSNALGQPSCLRPPMLQEGNFKPLTTASGVPLRVKKDVDGSALVSEAANRPSKLVKLDGGKVKVPSVPASGPSRALRSGLLPAGQSMAIDDVQHPGKQLLLPPEVEAALLQQVMNLTPEQLGSLPPEQQQQVVQLQQILK